MKTYTCTCGQLLFFDNVACVNCSREFGFLPDLVCGSSLDPAGNGKYVATATEAKNRLYKKCQNYAHAGVCNWMIPVENTNESFCVSCRLDTMIPDQTVAQNVVLWALTEAAKRRFVYSALRLKLPLANRVDDPQGGLGFRFLADTTNPDGSVARVITEHDHGLITLNIAEADDGFREKTRLGMKEPYRTLVGHFRHETGHYYWDRLVLNSRFLEPCRALFGDERQSYDDNMKKYYANARRSTGRTISSALMRPCIRGRTGPRPGPIIFTSRTRWRSRPDFGLVGKRIKIDPKGNAEGNKESLKAKPFDQVLDTWAELTIALNSLNRSMGLHDLYPFILSQPVVDKLYFISQVIAGTDEPPSAK